MVALINALGRYLVPRGAENLPLWDGRRKGQYEVWYLTLNDPATQTAFWLRYTLEAPTHGEAHGELWGHFFDRARPQARFGLRRAVPLHQMKLGEGAIIRLGDAELAEGRLHGALEGGGHSLQWDLQYTPSEAALMMMPAWIRSFLRRNRTDWAVPNPDVQFVGRIVADGRTFELDGAPGQQAHLYGARHADRWAWLHCTTFDGGADATVVGVVAETVLLGVRRPFTLVYVRYGGKDYLCNAFPQAAITARSDFSFPVWRFRCEAEGVEFVGTARGAPEQMVQIRYADPDGTPSYCCNTELADLELEVRRDGQVIDVLRAEGTAHVEFGQREKRDDVLLGVGS